MDQYNGGQSDEIDLRDLVYALWDSKILLVIFAVVGLIAGFAVQEKILNGVTSTAEYSRVDRSVEFEFGNINVLMQSATAYLEETAQANSRTFVDADFLLQSFARQLSGREPILAALSGDGATGQSDGDAQDFDYPPQAIGVDVPTDYEDLGASVTMAFPERDLATAVAFADRVASLADEQVRLSLLESLESLQQQVEMRRERGLRDVTAKIESARSSYRDKLESRIALLKENADIARASDIASNTLQSATLDGPVVAITEGGETEQPLYLRGYRVLEREIALLESRDSEDPYIEELIELKAQMRRFENEPLIGELEAVRQSRVLQPENFSSVRFQPGNVGQEQQVSSLVAMAVGLLFGIFVGIGFVLVRNVLDSRAASRSAQA